MRFGELFCVSFSQATSKRFPFDAIVSIYHDVSMWRSCQFLAMHTVPARKYRILDFIGFSCISHVGPVMSGGICKQFSGKLKHEDFNGKLSFSNQGIFFEFSAKYQIIPLVYALQVPFGVISNFAMQIILWKRCWQHPKRGYFHYHFT